MWRARFIYWFYRFLVATWRVRFIQHPETSRRLAERQPVVLAHWHGHEYSLIHLVRPLRLATMTSTSRDGQLVDYVIRKLGGQTSRGSSTRGGITALKGLVRFCREGRPASIAVDGPRGPYHVVKPGVFELSRLCSAPIVPVGAVARPVIHIKKAWNKAFVPLPFAKVVIYFAEPLPALTKEDDPKSEDLALRLARAIDDASGQAGKIMDAPQHGC